MGNKLVPGDLKPVSETSSDDYSKFVNSMAAEMEKELNDLMVQDGLPALSMDPTDDSIRDRRRLFVAIARGVAKHLKENKDAIDIRLDGDIILNPVVQPETIRVEGL